MKKDALEYYRRKLESLPDASLRTFARPAFDVEGVRRVHVVGVCGTAMASLAGLLVEAGYQVSGSDQGCYPPMSHLIEALDLEFHEGYAAEHLEGKDLIVIGNAIHADNPEAAAAREGSLPQTSVAEALQRFFMAGRRSVVVAGTHGKTTTTGLLAHVFTVAGLDPLYLIGGIVRGEERSFRFGHGGHFLIEGDEYDTVYFDKAPKFLHYRPSVAVVTSVELDHADIFRDVEDYRAAFAFFARELPPGGKLFAWGDDPAVTETVASSAAEVISYGLGDGRDLSARDVEVGAEGQAFTLVRGGRDLGRLSVPLHGDHNLLNTLAVCGVSLAEGIALDDLRAALATFPGMKRRQEVRGIVRGVVVLDDFAHHPTEVRETLRAIRGKYPERRLVAVFEPRSNTSRTKLFEEDYGRAFDAADLVFIAATPRLRPGDLLDGERIAGRVRERGTEAHYGGGVDDLLATLASTLTAGDAVLLMSNGDFGGIHERLLEALRG